MDSCQCQGIEAKFDQRYAARKLREYRKKGPKKTTWQLIEALRAEGVSGLTLLDIGGGVGDIQHEMLRSGVGSTINNEASTGYVDACRREAERLGHSDRIQHIQGNFVDMAQDLPQADIVTLDRVICCFDDMRSLVSLSARKARKLYGIVYPRDKWWIRLSNLVYYNFRNWLQRNPMRMFVHPPEAVEAVIRSDGLERRFYREMGPWQVVVYARA